MIRGPVDPHTFYHGFWWVFTGGRDYIPFKWGLGCGTWDVEVENSFIEIANKSAEMF
jgi:hypothetical protein